MPQIIEQVIKYLPLVLFTILPLWELIVEIPKQKEFLDKVWLFIATVTACIALGYINWLFFVKSQENLAKREPISWHSPQMIIGVCLGLVVGSIVYVLTPADDRTFDDRLGDPMLAFLLGVLGTISTWATMWYFVIFLCVYSTACPWLFRRNRKEIIARRRLLESMTFDREPLKKLESLKEREKRLKRNAQARARYAKKKAEKAAAAQAGSVDE